jgi:4-hydroxybenzoyl-CoA reductase subunit beta
MKLPPFEYAQPKSVPAACRLLKEQGKAGMILAGGTDLLQALKNRLKAPRVLVDLQGLHLDRIRYSPRTGLKIGALVSLRQLVDDPIVQEKYPMLSAAARQVGTAQLQAMGTVGGNLCQDNLCMYYNRSPMMRLTIAPCLKLGGKVCHAVSGSKDCWAVYSGDLAPALIALRARVVVATVAGKKSMALTDLFTGDGKKPNRLKSGQIVTEIHIPPPAPRAGGAYLKLRMRKTIDYPLLGVAVALGVEGQVCRDATLALTGVDKRPLWIAEAERLRGRAISDEAIGPVALAAHQQAHPLGNVSEMSAKYRRDMIDVYVRLAFQQAWQAATKAT